VRAVLAIHAIRPSLVGGCRPLDLLEFISEPKWRICFDGKLTAFAVPSQVVVAQKMEMAVEHRAGAVGASDNVGAAAQREPLDDISQREQCTFSQSCSMPTGSFSDHRCIAVGLGSSCSARDEMWTSS
jgi:hypothetical protein